MLGILAHVFWMAVRTFIIRELFENCRKAGKILGIQDDFQENIKEALEKLEPLRIGQDGRLLEWNEELEEADALRLIRNQLHLAEGNEAGTCPNFFGSHPPFQIDGNFGVASGIAEMLLQSREGHIFLLPALPAEWSEGSVAGLCARGGIAADMTWSEGCLKTVRLIFSTDGPVTLHYKESSAEVEGRVGESFLGEGAALFRDSVSG